MSAPCVPVESDLSRPRGQLSPSVRVCSEAPDGTGKLMWVAGFDHNGRLSMFKNIRELLKARGDDWSLHRHVLEQLRRGTEERAAIRIRYVRRYEAAGCCQQEGRIRLRYQPDEPAATLGCGCIDNSLCLLPVPTIADEQEAQGQLCEGTTWLAAKRDGPREHIRAVPVSERADERDDEVSGIESEAFASFSDLRSREPVGRINCGIDAIRVPADSPIRKTA
jgi:hypothetical protein